MAGSKDCGENPSEHEGIGHDGLADVPSDASASRRRVDENTRTSASDSAWRNWRNIEKKIKSGAVVIIDGGTGSEIEQVAGREALCAAGWSCTANLTHPEAVKTVHRQFLDAGADIIITNTYATSRHIMAFNNKEDMTVQNNLTGVQVAKEARDSYMSDAAAVGKHITCQPLIAGSISMHSPGNEKEKSEGKSFWPDPKQVVANYLEQAMLLINAGVDVLFLELVWTLEDGRRLLEAIKSIPKEVAIPVFVGITLYNKAICIEANDIRFGRKLVFDEQVEKPISEGAIEVKEFTKEIASDPNVVGINIMHTKCNLISAVSKALRDGGWTGVIGAYPDVGVWLRDGWDSDNVPYPILSEHADEWFHQCGIRLIGGCCGCRPGHIAALSRWADTQVRI
eukprot:TRINITY_DN17854_c0_g1_i1.p1 TRINITY_DN17854_c0_g1~~TRINITY_DN17854_c0_g1_i1.p1  ORF type:complete len:412 (+),score=55.27 TRINITY_DN17854_c0_g1_i1:51-1238(+)